MPDDTDPWQSQFLQSLAETGSPHSAAEAAGVPWSAALAEYRGDLEFRRAWRRAKAYHQSQHGDQPAILKALPTPLPESGRAVGRGVVREAVAARRRDYLATVRRKYTRSIGG